MPPDAEAGGADAATQTLTIQGYTFVAPSPYAEGSVLNANEAQALNQMFGENLRNNFANQVKAAKEKNGEDLSEDVLKDLRDKFATYSDDYEFQGRRTGGISVDPVMREAKKIARSKLEERLREKGVDKKSLKEGVFESLVLQLAEGNEAIRAEAKHRVEMSKQLAQSALSDIDAVIQAAS